MESPVRPRWLRFPPINADSRCYSSGNEHFFWAMLLIALATATSVDGADAATIALDVNLISNPGAELGSALGGGYIQIDDWTINDGPPGVDGFVGVPWGQPGGFPLLGDPGPEPISARGAYFFAGGGNNAHSSARQFITGGTAEIQAAIDGGTLPFDLSGWLGGYTGLGDYQEDHAVLAIRFLNAANVVIDTAEIGPVSNADRSSQTGLLFREKTGLVPSGTRSIGVELQMTRLNGTYNDGYADNLSLVFHAPLPPAPFNIFQWEYVNPANHSQGKQQSTVLARDGYGLQAGPGLNAAGLNLTKAFLAGANLAGASFSGANLSEAELRDADLTNATLENGTYANANFYQADLTGARLSGSFTRTNLSRANLTNANLYQANFTGGNLSQANLTGAMVAGANFASTHVALDQIYSTASYVAHNLAGVGLLGNDLSGGDFAGQYLATASFYAANLTGASFANADLSYSEFVNADLSGANLTGASFALGTIALANLSGANLANANLGGANLIGANLTGASISGAILGRILSTAGGASDGRPCGCGIIWWPGMPTFPTTYLAGSGVSLVQLVTTANYAAHDLSGVTLPNNNFDGGNFAGFNLHNASFTGTTIVGADFSGADARGATGLDVAAANYIRPDGHLAGLNLGAGQALTIRDYDAPAGAATIPIRVDQQLSLAAGATLRMIFDADAWDSTISFAAGIPVNLGGTLQLALAAGIDPLSQVGRTFNVFDWSGITPTGTFGIDSPYLWDVSQLYTSGKVTFLAAAGAAGLAPPAPVVPEPTSFLLLTIGLVAAWMCRRRHTAYILAALLGLMILPCSQSLAAAPQIQLAKVGSPVWKPVDFLLFSAPATPFDQEFGHVYNTLLPKDTAATYVPHGPPYDTDLSAGALAGGYVTQSLFTPDAITLHPNGVYPIFMLVPDPGISGSSRDFASGPVIPNSLFPILNNVDVWLDGVLVDRTPGADAVIPVQARDAGNDGISHLEMLQAIWHPWDDDLTVGPSGRYDVRISIRDASGSGWDAHIPFRVAIPGDYDYSGTVGPEDYAIWHSNFGSILNLDADGNDNHVVDAADYTIWRDHLGTSYSGGSAAVASLSSPPAVPEPSALVIALAGTASTWTVARRKGVGRRCNQGSQ